MSWRPDQPHNGLPSLPPAKELETPAVLKACIPTRAALAELKQAGELQPNQGVLINLEETTGYIQQALPRVYSHELVQVIFEQPYCRIHVLVERDIARRQTASSYLQQLYEIGVLREIRAGREKLFVHPKLVRLMTEDGNEIVPYLK